MNRPESRTPPQPTPGPDVAPLGAGIDFADPASPLAPYYAHTSHVVAAAVLGMLFLLASFVPLWYTDVWGHLSFGRWIVEHGRLPAHEPFNPRADPQAPALHAYWLIQVGLYLLYRLGELLAGGDAWQRMAGGVAVLRATLALVLLLRCLALLAAYRRLGGSLPAALLGVVLMLAASVGHITVLRPQVFGELCFAGLLLALSRPVLSRRALVLVPLLMAVWANVHGSYPGGLALLAACLAGRVLSVWRARSLGATAADPQARRLLLAVVLSAGGIALLNPHGPFIYWHTWQMGRNPNVNDMDEWQPLSFSRSAALVWIYLASLVLLALTPLLSRRFYSPAQLLVLAGFAWGPLGHVRMMVWWYMLVPWLWFPHWPALRARLLPQARLVPGVPTLRKTLLAAAILVVLALWSAPGQWAVSGSPPALDRSLFPGTPWQLAAQLRDPDGPAGAYLPALTEALAARYPQGRFTGCLFASETQGDYLLWALAPESPVFIYTHVHLFRPESWRECSTVKFARPGWRDVLDGHHANLVVVEAEMYPELCALLHEDPDWLTLLDETGSPAKFDSRARLFIALRRVPR